MKLYMVIYLAGKIGGSFGPLPYGLDECEHRRDEMLADLKPGVTTPQGYTAADVRLTCEFLADHPVIEFPPE